MASSISIAYVRMVMDMLKVEVEYPENLVVEPKDVTVPAIRKFLATHGIARSDHWIEFALRSVPLNVDEA